MFSLGTSRVNRFHWEGTDGRGGEREVHRGPRATHHADWRPPQPVSLYVEFNIPVEVVTPAVGRRLDPERYMDRWQPPGFSGDADQLDAGLGGRSTSLSVVAAEASRYDVVPTLLATRRNRYDVIESQIFSGKRLPAILAGMPIPCVDIGSRELDATSLADTCVLDEAAYGRELDSERDAVDFAIVFVDHFDLPCKEQG